MSYTTVQNLIEEFAQKHEMIAEFQSERMDGVSVSDTTNYPMLFFNPLGEDKSNNGYSYKVQLYILDDSLDNHFISKEYCVKKCHKIAHDLYNYLAKVKFNTPQDFVINSLFNFERDKVHGVSVDFDVIGAGGCVTSLNSLINGN